MVVSQPHVGPTTRLEAPPRANDYLIFTVVLMVVCFVCGVLLTYIYLVPALIILFSMMVSVQCLYDFEKSASSS